MAKSILDSKTGTLLLISSALALGMTAAGCSSDSSSANPGGGTGGASAEAGAGGSSAAGAGGKGGTSAGGGAGKGGAPSTGGKGNGGAPDVDAGDSGSGGGGGTAGDGGGGDGGTCTPDAPVLPTGVATDILVPAGTELAQQFHAVGTQNYQCKGTAQPADGGTLYAWAFIGPTATLTDSCGKTAGNHKAGPLGPTGPQWLSAADGSMVQGAKKKSSVVAGAVPELLLQASDHSGTGIFSSITYIQRLHTTGGVAPDNATCSSTNVDEEQDIAYTADYYFYTGPSDSGTP